MQGHWRTPHAVGIVGEMPRPMRDVYAGFFHVWTHSVWAADALFRDDTDRFVFLRELVRAIQKARWKCLAFCLMNTHYHLVLEVDDGALPFGMHALNFRYACGYNQRHEMKGHVHGSRYGARRLGDDAALLDGFRYVARNPVEAMLCATPEGGHGAATPGRSAWRIRTRSSTRARCLRASPGRPSIASRSFGGGSMSRDEVLTGSGPGLWL